MVSYFDRLYPQQDEVLRLINAEITEFYLTGGATASRSYLPSRFGSSAMLRQPRGFGNDPLD